MLISLDWIKEFVNIPEQDAKTLGEKFTLATAEVEDVETINACFSQIRVAEIVSIEQHPDADKLNLVTFNYGESEKKRVVCGAANVRVGLKTPFAPIGVTLPNGLTLEPRPIRGVLSEGMLCSEEELGFAEKSKGIMELPEDAPVGTSLDEYMSLKQDIVLDVDNKSLTHRPDLWGHFGLAREFSAIYREPLCNPFSKDWATALASKIPSDNPEVKVSLDKDSAGVAYFGLTVDGVKVGESPKWMQSRLIAAGLRPINSIVDISNYVMLELGMPNHIFDRKQISGDTVFIKELKGSEKFVTLDEIERDLVAGDTVISDDQKPLVIGGLMGGLNSGVTDDTTKVFLEVANWIPSRVRKTSTRLGLRTDSSQRYEKSLDSHLCYRTMLRLLDLIIQLNPDAKVSGGLAYDGEDLNKYEPLKMDLSCHRVREVLGHQVSDDEIKEILQFLDYGIDGSGEGLKVTVPSYRATKDIECEADLVEEIGRIVGYDNIKEESPLLDISPIELSPAQKLHRKVSSFMVNHARSFELQTYPLVGADLLKKALWNQERTLKLINALSNDAEIMRPSLIPSHLEVVAKNVKHFDKFNTFEIGRVYQKGKKEFSDEQTQIIVTMYHQKQSCFTELANVVERLLGYTSLPGQFADKNPKFKSEVVAEDWKGLHPTEFYNIRLMGQFKGAIFTLHPWLLRQFKIKGNVSMAVINLGGVEERPVKEKVKYSPLARFPKSSFDWSVVADKNEPVANILGALKKTKLKHLVDTKVVGTFDLEDNKKSVTLQATFLDPEKTLEGDFLTQARDQLVTTLDKAGYPLKV